MRGRGAGAAGANARRGTAFQFSQYFGAVRMLYPNQAFASAEPRSSAQLSTTASLAQAAWRPASTLRGLRLRLWLSH